MIRNHSLRACCVFALAAIGLLSGCGKEAAPPPNVKVETIEIEMTPADSTAPGTANPSAPDTATPTGDQP